MKELRLYGYVGGNINQSVVNTFLADAKGEDILVRLHTCGGSVFEGNLIYNSFANYKGKKNLIIDGVSASMGTVIQSAFDYIEMVRNGFVMIHTPSGWTEGNASAHESNSKLLRSLEKNFKGVYSKRTEVDLDKLMDGNDHWFDAEEALANGFIDNILDVDSDNANEAMALLAVDKTTAHKYLMAAFKPKETRPQNNYIPNNQNSKTMNAILKQKAIALLAMFAINMTLTSTDDSVIESMLAQLESEKKEKDAALAKLKAFSASSIKAAIDAAIKSQKIKETQRASFEKIGTDSGLETLNDVLAAIEPYKSVVDQIEGNAEVTGGSKENMNNWDWDTYQAKAPELLEAMETKDNEKFQKLYDAKYPNKTK